MHPGGAGTPPAGGGSGAPRPGPARTGQTRGTPTAGARCPPAWHGDPTAPPPGPRTRWSPPHSFSEAAASTRGCPQPRGAPMERETLVTAGCHRVRERRTTRHSWALPRHAEVMPNRLPTPCSSPPAPHSPESSTLRIPGQLPPWVSLSPSFVSLSQLPSRHPLLLYRHSVLGFPLEPHQFCLNPLPVLLAPTCACLCTHPPIPYLSGMQGCTAVILQVSVRVATWGLWSPLPLDTPCPTDLSLGTFCAKREGQSPVGTCDGAARGDPSVAPEPHLYLHTSTPDLPWIFPPTLFTARAVIALFGIGGSEQPHSGPPPFRSPGTAGGLFKFRIKLVLLE